MAWANCAIVFWDGCTGRLAMKYRIATIVVALLFGAIGGIVLGVERGLSKVHRCTGMASGGQPLPELVGTWQRLYVFLTGGVLLILVVMGSGLFAIIGRLHQGSKIFG